jgi:crotonobetainyl-CoA:carnitine CoA-transferase CaiB-like acyl-CoA transferase
MTKPLQNIRVIDLTEALAGPVCGMMLGDFGANVIKVERPNKGDKARRYGPPFVNGESPYFMSLNRNKRSLTLNIQTAEGQKIIRELLLSADIFLLNMPRQASWKKYGIDYETISAENPGIIYAAISGYGHTGPKAGTPGYDVIAQGEAGTMSLTGEPDHPPTRFPTPMADMTTGLYATIGILAALQARHQTGQGQLLDLALVDSQVTWLTNLVPGYLLTGNPPARLGNSHPMIVPYRVYLAKDKGFNVGVGTEGLWQRFCEAINLPQLADDPRFKTNPERVDNRHILEPILEAHFAREDAAVWLEKLKAVRVPCGPVNSLPDILNDEHYLARGGVIEMEHPAVGVLKMLGNPIHFSETPPQYERHPPLLGEHTAEILGELGYSIGEVKSMKEKGIL